MESVALANVDTAKFLSHDASSGNSTITRWRCCNFLLKMLEEGVHADITLRANGGSVKAHKSVLACVSPVFNAMFQHDMKEQLTSIVDIPDMTIDALQVFLLMLYNSNSTNEASNDNMCTHYRQMPQLKAAIDTHFDEIHKAVFKYQVESRLGSVLISALARNLTPENCWLYYNSSSMGTTTPFNQSASKVCNDYILGNYHNVIKSNSFVEEMKCNPNRIHNVIMLAESQNERAGARRRFLQIKSL